MVVVLRDKVRFMVADHPPYNSSLSQYMHHTPVFFLVPLSSFVSVIPFTNTSTCISPPSVPLLVFSLTPPILCVYLPSICATPCLLSNPSPLLCQLFLSSFTPTCISPPSLRLLVFSLTPPLFCVIPVFPISLPPLRPFDSYH